MAGHLPGRLFALPAANFSSPGRVPSKRNLAMRYRLRTSAACGLAVAMLVAGCRQPQQSKESYLQQGDALVAQHKDAEAALAYRNALQIDGKFGAAHFKLAEIY